MRPIPMKNIRVEVTYRSIDQIKPDPQNARKHPDRQLSHLRASIREFGFRNPILIDEQGQIIAGHARLEAAKAEGLQELPCMEVSDLSPVQRRGLAIADNRIPEHAIWDEELLKQQLIELIEADVNIESAGYISAEVDLQIDAGVVSTTKAVSDPDDDVPEVDPASPAISRPGDLWQLDEHILLCANSLEDASFQQLLGDQRAQMIIQDPPYNVPIAGHVSGLGRVQHREFAMASGEMSPAAFTEFLSTNFKLCAKYSIDGSVHYQFMDWRGLRPMLDAGEAAYTRLLALCVWNKTNGGMGSLYRSKHELVFVWKSGTAPHINNVELGRHGRYRCSVWDYAGVNTFRRGRDEDLAVHPTVKPVGMMADAMRDCSKPGGLVLDAFGGSGTTIIAAERTKRRAAVIEIDPVYVDVSVRRWQDRTGRSATLRDSGQTFAEVAQERLQNRQSARSEEPSHD